MVRTLIVFLSAFATLTASAAVCELRKVSGDTLEIIPFKDVEMQDDQNADFFVTPVSNDLGFMLLEARTGIDSFVEYVVVVDTQGKSIGCKQNTILKSGTFIGAEARCKDFTIECAVR
jgi:hypothetical protein